MMRGVNEKEKKLWILGGSKPHTPQSGRKRVLLLGGF